MQVGYDWSGTALRARADGEPTSYLVAWDRPGDVQAQLTVQARPVQPAERGMLDGDGHDRSRGGTWCAS